MIPSLRRALGIGAWVAVVMAATSGNAFATHFRYGTIKWEVTASTATQITLKVTVESAWRRSYFGTPTVGQSVLVDYLYVYDTAGTELFFKSITATVLTVNGTEDWFIGTYTTTVDVAKSGLPVSVVMDSCCRVSSLLDLNADDPFIVKAIVPTTATSGNTASPVSTSLPIISVQAGQSAATFTIPASDPDNKALTFSIATVAQSGLTTASPTGLSINGTTGTVTWNTTGLTTGLRAIQFLVTDADGGVSPVDVILNLTTQTTTNNTPEMQINNSASAQTFTVEAGAKLTFILKGTDADGGSVTLSSGAIPLGSTVTPSLPSAGTAPYSATFTWIPTLTQVGTQVLVFAVTDSDGAQDTNSVTITVTGSTHRKFSRVRKP